MQEIKGLLFDIGGVLYVGDKVIEGAAESVAALAEKFPMRFVTNTTRRVPSAVFEKLRNFGFEVKEEQLFTALTASRDFLREKEAKIIGKPSGTFFHLAVNSMGLEPHEVLMVGDDIEADIKGAQDAGLKALLVKTGKFQPADLEREIIPTHYSLLIIADCHPYSF